MDGHKGAEKVVGTALRNVGHHRGYRKQHKQLCELVGAFDMASCQRCVIPLKRVADRPLPLWVGFKHLNGGNEEPSLPS